MRKFAFIGAGSMNFTRVIVRDLLTFPEFFDCEIALMDINPERLDYIGRCVDKVVAEMKSPAKVIKTLDRKTALDGADGVLCTIFNGDIDIWRYDIEVPMKYGVDINIGDTRSISGFFRALRNIPVMLDICRDIEKYCPKAVFLNYTNPMAMLCKAMQANTKVNVTGLCHSVQGTISMLANWIEKPLDEITYLCAGVNHQAFYIDFKWNGEDAYPLLREKLRDPAIYNREQVRNEIFLKFGYYVTESSGHNSEYTPWFRKSPDLIEKYCTHGTNWNPGEHAYSLNMRIDREKTWRGDIEKWLGETTFDANRSKEYAGEIFNAVLGDKKPFEFNGNVLNRGSISNLPFDACVEVPVVASRMGIRQTVVGELPKTVAVLVNHTAELENLIADAAITGNRDEVYSAVYNDPLCEAVCSLEEMKLMTDELFEINRDFLPQFN